MQPLAWQSSFPAKAGNIKIPLPTIADSDKITAPNDPTDFFIKDENGNPLDYDISAQTEACILNIDAILKSSGAKLGDIVDVTSFLINMDRDFEGYNEVYAKFFAKIQATRTTLAISALPTPIAVEMKVIANLG